MRYLIPWALLATLLLGCPEGGDDDAAADDDSAGDDDTAADPCAAAWALPGGTLEGTVVDQASFAAVNGRYTAAGGLVVNGTDGGLSLTLSCMFDTTGASILDAVDAGEFPLEIALGHNDAFTGYATVYEGAATYVSDDQHSGWMVLSGMDDGQLVGCFEFEAKQTAGEAVQAWTDGLFHVPSM